MGDNGGVDGGESVAGGEGEERSGFLDENGFDKGCLDAFGAVDDAIVFLIASTVAFPAAVAFVVRCIVGFDAGAFGAEGFDCAR